MSTCSFRPGSLASKGLLQSHVYVVFQRHILKMKSHALKFADRKPGRRGGEDGEVAEIQLVQGERR